MPAINQSAKTPIKKPKLSFPAKAAIALGVVTVISIPFLMRYSDRIDRERKAFAAPAESTYAALHFGDKISKSRMNVLADVCQAYGFAPSDLALFVRMEDTLLIPAEDIVRALVGKREDRSKSQQVVALFLKMASTEAKWRADDISQRISGRPVLE